MATIPKSEVSSPADAAGEARALDEQVLELREAGKSYATIAKSLGFQRSLDANESFNRALRRRPAKDRKVLRSAEAKRLEALAMRCRAREDLSPEQVDKRLRSIERLRQTLMMD